MDNNSDDNINQSDSQSDRIINTCILICNIIFVIVLVGSIGVYILFDPTRKIKPQNETNVMGVISIIILSIAFLTTVVIIVNKYCITTTLPRINVSLNNGNEILDEVVVEGNYAL